jgi:hypothetical protein
MSWTEKHARLTPSNRETISRALGMGMLVLASSCASAAGPSETSQVHEGPAASIAPIPSETLAPLVEIQFSAHHSFEIYDYGNSAAYSETGAYLDSPVRVLNDEDFSDPVNVFAKLAPGEPTPASLLEFSARLATRRATIDADAGPAETTAPAQPGTQLVMSFDAVPEREPLSSSSAPAASHVVQTVVVVPSKKLQLADDGQSGAAGGNCPFAFFQSVSGPLGPFCPPSGSASQVWCYQNLNNIGADASYAATSSALVSMCVDAGQALLNVRVYQPLGTQKIVHSYNQAAGTWRQWRVMRQCRCDSKPWWCPICTPACFCDIDFGIGFDVPPIPNDGRVHVGGYWNPL